MRAQPRAIRSICVAGSGIVARSAALAFARALPGVELTILDSGEAPGPIDRAPASLPTIHRCHRAIGLDELDLVRAGIATHLLGTRFERWSSTGAGWFHGFGEHGLPAGDVPFHAVWHQAGRPLPFQNYSAAAVLAEAGRFAHPSPDPNSPMGRFLYGLRLDPDRYLERLRAATAGLPQVTGRLLGAERRSDGGVAALHIEGGRRIEADLFVDCTGQGAALLSSLDEAFEDWGRWLPCDRFRFGSEPAEEPTPTDRVEAVESGWRWRSPLPDRTILIEASSSAFAGETAGEAAGEPVPLRAGRRPSPWIHNVLALGEAAVAVDPLHGAGLHLAHGAILRALELLPGRDCHPLELAEYNRRTGQEVVRVRDFLALAYLRSGRADTPFWRALAQEAPPATLARTLEQWVRRARLPFMEEESFDKDSWLAALIGLGVAPDHLDPAVGGVDIDRARQAMEGYARRLAELPQRLPPYREVLTRMSSTARSG